MVLFGRPALPVDPAPALPFRDTATMDISRRETGDVNNHDIAGLNVNPKVHSIQDGQLPDLIIPPQFRRFCILGFAAQSSLDVSVIVIIYYQRGAFL
jgi:hypothetical protein